MVNAIAQLEAAGIDFRTDRRDNVVEVDDGDTRAHDMLGDEGGEVWFG